MCTTWSRVTPSHESHGCPWCRGCDDVPRYPYPYSLTMRCCRRELQLTITILVSTILFVLLNLPTVSNSIAYNAYPVTYGPFSVQKYLFYFLQDFGGVCFLLTFSTDFFTYVALSSAYRSCLRGFFTLGRRTASKKSETNSEITTSTAT